MAPQLSWLERRANNAKVTGSIPLGARIFFFQKKVARAGARTLDRQVKSLTLYRLSYPGTLIALTKFCEKAKLLRAGFEPATYGFLNKYNYSPPLYQLSYRRCDDSVTQNVGGKLDRIAGKGHMFVCTQVVKIHYNMVISCQYSDELGPKYLFSKFLVKV